VSDQERYILDVEQEILRQHKITLGHYIHSIIARFERAGHTARDCAASIHYVLERETKKAEREASGG